MKIIVCIRHVSYLGSQLGFNPIENSIKPDALMEFLNPYDECAIEAAIRIKESFPNGSEVTAMTIGPEKSEKSLKKCLAMGADHALRIWDETLSDDDAWMTASVLGRAIRNQNYNLVLCGKRGVDSCRALVGTYLAEFLGLPMVSGVMNLEITEHGKKAIVHKGLGKGDREVIEAPLPALFTVDEGLNDPRYPDLNSRLNALEEDISVHDYSSPGMEPDLTSERYSAMKLVGISLPKTKPRKSVQVDSSLPAHERLKLMMSGGAKKKDGGKGFIEGDPEMASSKVVDFLKDHGFLPK